MEYIFYGVGLAVLALSSIGWRLAVNEKGYYEAKLGVMTDLYEESNEEVEEWLMVIEARDQINLEREEVTKDLSKEVEYLKKQLLIKPTVDDIAKVCHEVNRSICISQGDMSQPKWKDAPEWQKQSTMDGINFHLNNPMAMASQSHENWLQHKMDTLWTYGEVKDPDNKTHPCMVPFEELPIEQQLKDYTFQAVVHAMS